MRTTAATSGNERGTTFEVHRLREPGEYGAARPPLIEVFAGLDRARIAALGYALDGPTAAGDRFTGRVLVYRVFRIGGERVNETLIDDLDERVAFRVLNELALPRADAMAVSLERLQGEVSRMAQI
ncbi:hypothetical protein [Erythrobacter donghaensis]|uniref:hypothetical protein n=1 Tax=Erythrobacter donghaensis TaxID=267135 RepID=UPI000A379FB8|nr:hypothetical protein [Erythrobacter donghaensis]